METGELSQDQREQYVHHVTNSGWMRIKPPLVFLFLIGLGLKEEPPTWDDLRTCARTTANPDGAWDGSCWDDPDDPEEATEQEEHKTFAAQLAAHFGLPPIETVEDVKQFLRAAGLVHEVTDTDGTTRLHPLNPLPYPEDALPLDEAERAAQRQLRMQSAYEDDSYRIINLFDPDGQRLTHITTSLQRLARTIDGVPHDARQALQLLLGNGDFHANVDTTTVAEHKVFQLNCDWDAFDASRIGIHGIDDEGHLRVTLPADA